MSGQNRKQVNAILRRTAERAVPVDVAFHRWAATHALEPSERTSFLELWKWLSIGARPAQCASLLDEVFDFFERKMEKYHDNL